MLMCWNSVPEIRPCFSEIIEHLDMCLQVNIYIFVLSYFSFHDRQIKLSAFNLAIFYLYANLAKII